MSFNGADRLHPDFWKDPSPWKDWYAWYPVKIKGKWVWLKTVYRKYNWAKSTSFPFGDEYDYGDIFDVLGDGNKQ